MHLASLRDLQRRGAIGFTGVCDVDETKAAAFARQIGAEAVFTDADAMLAKGGADGVMIIVPPLVTPQLIRLAIRHRLPFFCEKPPAPDSATHRALIREAGELPHLVGYNRRHGPYMVKAREWLRGFQIQSVTAAFSRYRRCEADFSSTAVHAIDAVRCVGGEDFATVNVEVSRTGEVPNYYINGWYRSGARYDILITPDTASADEHYVIRSAGRTVFLSFPHRNVYDVPGYVERREGNKVIERLGPADLGYKPDDIPGLAGIRAEHETFIRLLQTGEAVSSTLAATLQTQEVRERMVEAMKRRGLQPVPPQ